MLRNIRTNYQKFELSEATISKNPLDQLSLWLQEAIENKSLEPTSMVLSTVDMEMNPDSRVVLLKEISGNGLTFFTNYESKKGQQLATNQHVSVVLFWPEMERQVRVKGITEKIDKKESELYFKSRPLDSQLSAWASQQSQIIENRQVLDDNYTQYKQFFESHKITKPPFWGGYLIRPEYFEFWQGRSNRLHDRIEFCLSGQSWIIHRLAP